MYFSLLIKRHTGTYIQTLQTQTHTPVHYPLKRTPRHDIHKYTHPYTSYTDTHINNIHQKTLQYIHKSHTYALYTQTQIKTYCKRMLKFLRRIVSILVIHESSLKGCQIFWPVNPSRIIRLILDSNE